MKYGDAHDNNHCHDENDNNNNNNNDNDDNNDNKITFLLVMFPMGVLLELLVSCLIRFF